MGCTLLALAAMGCQTAGRDTLTQVSTIGALLIGLYNGHFPVGELRVYGDFGIGTFDRLDGEMIVIDGVVYKARSNGEVVRVSANETTPFATVSHFRRESSIDIAADLDYAALEARLTDGLASPNLFHAVRVDGAFSYVKVRSVPAQSPPYRPLVEVVTEQAEFELHHVEGSLVGYYVPAFSDRINVPGYHLHFITTDRARGGHVLALTTGAATAQLDPLRALRMTLPSTGDFLGADLARDQSRARDTVERGR